MSSANQTPEVANFILCFSWHPPDPLNSQHNGLVHAPVTAAAASCFHPVAPSPPECWRVPGRQLPRLGPEADPAPVAA